MILKPILTFLTEFSYYYIAILPLKTCIKFGMLFIKEMVMNPEFSDSSNDSDVPLSKSGGLASRRPHGGTRDSALNWSTPYGSSHSKNSGFKNSSGYNDLKNTPFGQTGVLGSALSSIGNDAINGFRNGKMVEYSDSEDSLDGSRFVATSNKALDSKQPTLNILSSEILGNSQKKPNQSLSVIQSPPLQSQVVSSAAKDQELQQKVSSVTNSTTLPSNSSQQQLPPPSSSQNIPSGMGPALTKSAPLPTASKPPPPADLKSLPPVVGKSISVSAALHCFDSVPWASFGLSDGPYSPLMPIMSSFHAKVRLRQVTYISKLYQQLCDALRSNASEFQKLQIEANSASTAELKHSKLERIKYLFDCRSSNVETARKHAKLLHEWLRQGRSQLVHYVEEIKVIRAKGLSTINLCPASGLHLGSLRNKSSFRSGGGGAFEY